MSFSASSLSTNIIVTVSVALLVLLLPHFDRKICRELGVNLAHHMYGHAKEDRLLRLRQLILYVIFLLYLLANAYLVFFSRSASEAYLIHTALLADLKNSVRIDSGILGVLATIYTQGLSEGFSQIHVDKPEDIAQVYMNIMLYVPMGYLLPYVFNWMRSRVRIRPALTCFIISFITENLQLIFKRGFYDLDDLISNTLGGIIGQFLYITFAYVVTHPNWRKNLREYHKWRFHARRGILFPFARKIGIARTTLIVSDQEIIRQFYIKQLGLRSVNQMVDVNSGNQLFLLQIGSFHLEILCPAEPVPVGEQYLTLSVKNIEKLRKHLTAKGCDPGSYCQDPYTGMRMLRMEGPEHVHISFVEV